jgi:asparagine synthase (glutamine-hydrolysing)
MCGLFAQWSAGAVEAGPVLAVLRSRGPDDLGQWAQPVAGGMLQLLHSRLAIQDLSPAGHQPMQSADQRFTLVFNGEIYNAPDLRDQLTGQGVRFRSHSDTEVLLAGFARWGVELFPRLNGIFALAIWDASRQELTLARDRCGVKPLLWWRGPEGWALASELSVLRAAGVPARPRLDRVALEQFWQWGAVQAPFTLVAGVQAVPPGHWARWCAGESPEQWQLQGYAGWPSATYTPSDLSYGEAVAAVAAALEQAVARQMLADVPVGAFLSGGLDSAALVALMMGQAPTPVRTFSLGFAADDLSRGVVDERNLAATTARHLGTQHQEVVLSGAEVLAGIDSFCDAIDQPSVDGLNTFLVAGAARAQGLTVAVSGLGGDELLAGYPVFERAWRFHHSSGVGAGLMGRLPWRLLQRLGWEHRRFACGSVAALADHRRLHAGEQPFAGHLLPQEQDLDPVAQLSRLELRGYMANTLLRDTDAVTMHHGLELRVPFLDNDLVDLLLQLPSAYKFRPSSSKPLLWDAMAERLPPDLGQVPKRGFELPLARWLMDLDPPSLAPDVLGAPWPGRIRAARRLYRSKPHRYHGWWQWQVLARWLALWPELLADSAGYAEG